MEYIKASDLLNKVNADPLVVVNVYAEKCPHCVTLKERKPELKTKVPVVHMSVEDADNAQLLSELGVEAIPYTMVFDKGEFKGGESLDITTLQALCSALEDKHGIT